MKPQTFFPSYLNLKINYQKMQNGQINIYFLNVSIYESLLKCPTESKQKKC